MPCSRINLPLISHKAGSAAVAHVHLQDVFGNRLMCEGFGVIARSAHTVATLPSAPNCSITLDGLTQAGTYSVVMDVQGEQLMVGGLPWGCRHVMNCHICTHVKSP